MVETKRKRAVVGRGRQNEEEQLNFMLFWQDNFTFRRSREIIRRQHGVSIALGWARIAALLGVDVATLRRAIKIDKVVQRLIKRPKGRVYLDLKTMTDLDWVYLDTALIIRGRGAERKHAVAIGRKRGTGARFVGVERTKPRVI